jgi:TetR/AcrR family transcriptional regulator
VAGPREVRRRQRIELSREQILDTAEELFSERGYHGASLRDVAERCEFSVGALYQFFDSKDALYEEVLMRRGPEMGAGMARIAASGIPADEQLLAMAQMQAELFRAYPVWGRLTIRVLTPGIRPVDLPASFPAGFKAAIDAEARLFERGQREGVLCEGDPRALARLFSSLVSAFHGLDTGVSDEPEDFSLPEFLELVRRTFVVRPASPGH